METLSKFMTVAEAAKVLGVTDRSVYNFFESGRLTEYRDPKGEGPVRVLREEVENFFRPKIQTDLQKVSKPA